MKKIYCLLSVLLISTFSFAQHCDVPMPPNIFKQQLKAIATQPDDAQRLRYAKSLFPSDCMLSSQAKEMAMVFTKDYYRLEFVKLAWPNIFDSDNFYDLYDVFSSLSSAIRLYDYVNKGQNNYVPPPSPAPGSNWYPDISYPSPDTYKGMTGCKLPIADHDFEVLSRPARNQKTDDMRRGEAIKLVTGNCLSMSQAMKLGSLLEMESMRLTFMKEVFPQLFDLENYTYAAKLFSHVPYKNDWLAFCDAALEALNQPPTPASAPPCIVTAADFTSIKKTINDVSVNSTRLNLAKQVVSTKKCFTTQQLRELLDLFVIESSKLELAKFSYDYCTDKDNYYQFTSAFNITSYKNDLIEFINSKKN